jgi:hypothetical protein
MMTRALPLLFLVACSKGQASREADCKAIKAIVGKTPGDMPRRYRNTIVEGSFDELNKLALGDPGVKKAVRERDATELILLCNLDGRDPHENVREHDCRLLNQLYIPPNADGTGIWDPDIGNGDFHDPEVRAAAKELGSDGWKVYSPLEIGSADQYAKLRALCGTAGR